MIVNFFDLKSIRNNNMNKKIVMCSGWFDLFHVGHLRFLQSAKKQGDILIIFVRSDEDGKIVKGIDRPIINQYQRMELLDNLKCVDYVILGNEEFFTTYDIFNVTVIDKLRILKYVPIIEELRPDIIYAIEESFNYNKSIPFILNKLNIPIVYHDRTNNISTTDIISKININNKQKGDEKNEIKRIAAIDNI